MWDTWLQEHPKASKIPPVIPVVLYHGPQPWAASTSLADVLDLPEVALAAAREHLPLFRFLGLVMGWFSRAFLALNPLVQLLRPISPIAWIPVAILWFGIDDQAPIFLIFLASLFPLVTATIAAVRSIPPVYLRAARNFELSRVELFRRVVLPAALPQLLTGVRLALGIAWLVVVAAEMIAVDSGLGYLIIDARNAGRRYDLVVAGMVAIGVIGLALDWGVRRLERFDEVVWATGDGEAPS